MPAANIAFMQARQTEHGCAVNNYLAIVQILGGQNMKSVPTRMLFRYLQA
jgi:hypothetical protein